MIAAPSALPPPVGASGCCDAAPLHGGAMPLDVRANSSSRPNRTAISSTIFVASCLSRIAASQVLFRSPTKRHDREGSRAGQLLGCAQRFALPLHELIEELVLCVRWRGRR